MTASDTPRTGEAAYPVSSGIRTYMLLVLTATYTLAFMDRQIINILAEPIKHDLHLADWQMGAMTGLAFALLYTILGVPIARISERGNRSYIIAAALAIWSAFTAISGLANNFIHLLLARIGVGIGEAGCTPPAHSLITDITPREKRAGALAFYSMGLPIGTLLGMALGGIVAELFGWRAAFLLVGAPGIVLAIGIVFTVKDPRAAELRDLSVARPDVPPLKSTLAAVASTKSFRWMAFGAALIALAGYGQQTFYGSFYLRNHEPGLDWLAGLLGFDGRLAVLGIALGLILGLTATAGTVAGGRFGDFFARKGARGYLSVPICATAVAVPFLVAAFYVQHIGLSLFLLAIPSFLKAMWYGPVFASVQSIVAPRSRATAVAIFLFVVNAIGLGLGPVLTGLLSDLCARWFGPAEGLRVAMIILSMFVLLAAACFAMARRTIEDDICS